MHMTKKILSMILAIVMVVSLFAGITITASAATQWTLVTSVDEIVAGENYVLLVNNKTASYNGTISSKHLQSTSGWVFTGDTATTVPSTIVTITFEAVDGVENAYYLKDSNNKYITATKAGSGGFSLATSDSYGWTFAAGASGFKACYNNTAAAAGIWSYNNSSFRSYAYTNSNYQNGTYDIYLAYEKEVTGTVCTHDNATSEVTTPATCTEAGVTTWTCPDCDAAPWTTVAPEALGHIEGEPVGTPATCTTAGSVTPTCTREGCTTVFEATAVPPTGHTFVDGVCSVCSIAAETLTTYELVTLGSEATETEPAVESTVTSGNYVIGSTRTLVTYPSLYLATSACSGDWNVTENAVSAVDGVLTSDLLDGALVVTLTGDNTNGFTVSYTDDSGAVLYLGYSDVTANRKLAFSAEYSTILWTVVDAGDGGFALSSAFDDGTNSGNYVISQGNTTAVSGIRGYKSGTIYKGLYLFKETAPAVECAHTNVVEIPAVDPTCTTAGNTAGTKCADCGEVLSGNEFIAALGHDYVDGICTECEAVEPTGYSLATVLNNYDEVIIYYPTDGVAMTATASGSKLAGTAATPVDGVLEATSDMAVMTVSYLEGSTTDFYLLYNSTYLTSGSTGNSLTFAAEVSDYAVWYLEVADVANGIVYIHNRNAKYNTSAQSLEYYSGFTTYGSGTTAAYQFQLYTKAGEAPACEHVWGDWAETTAPTCTAVGVQTRSCTLCGEVQTSDIPATGHTYVYGEAAVTCSACDYNAAYTLSDIATVKDYTADNVYYFKGVVTYVSGKTVYIEDATAGICVYFTNNSAAAGIAVGDEILVWDTITTYKGLIETTNTTAQEYVKVSEGNALPNNTTVTLADLLADTTNEYLGERVTISGLTMGAIVPNGSTNITDAEGNSIVLFKANGMTENVTEGDTVTITAIVSTYNGYQLLVNPGTITTDVVVTTEADAGEPPLDDYSGNYYIAALRDSGNYWYMTSDLGTASTKRYQAVDSGLTELPTSITDAISEKTFTIAKNEDGTYTICAYGVEEGYLSWTSGNSGKLVAAADAKALTITGSGYVVTVTFKATDTETRYLSLNKTDGTDYFAFYTGTQVNTLVLIPVEGEAAPCTHTNTIVEGAVEATCTAEGYTGDTVCLDCGVVVTEGTATEMIDHDYVDGICTECEAVEPVTTMTVYAINSSNWSEVYAYVWCSVGSYEVAWPGTAMTKTEDTVNGFDVYSYTYPATNDMLIFNNNSNGSQTGDLTGMDGKYYDIKTATWYNSLDEVPVIDPLATGVTMAGEFNDWSTLANEFMKAEETDTVATLTLELAAETSYQFKIVNNNTWTSCSTAITGDVSGLSFSSSVNDNATITTAAAGIYTFTYDLVNNTLSVVYPEVIPVGPTETAIKFGYAVSFDSDLKMNYRIKLENIAAAITNYTVEGAYLVVEKDQYFADGTTGVDTQTLTGSVIDSRLVFTLSDIQSVEMGSELRAVLHIFDTEGNEYYTPVDVISIKAYAQGFLEMLSYETNPEYVTMLIDLLNYGSAAQTYFGRRADVLANAGMDAYQQYATKELSEELNDQKTVVTTERTITAVDKISFSVNFNDKTEMNAKLTLADGYTAEDITCVKVLDAEGNVVETLTEGVVLEDGKVQFTYYGVKSIQMREMYYFVAYVGEEVASDSNGYSVEAYCKGCVDYGTETMADMGLKCMYYGDSAYAYFN